MGLKWKLFFYLNKILKYLLLYMTKYLALNILLGLAIISFVMG